jgi:hypothetical protein
MRAEIPLHQSNAVEFGYVRFMNVAGAIQFAPGRFADVHSLHNETRTNPSC